MREVGGIAAGIGDVGELPVVRRIGKMGSVESENATCRELTMTGTTCAVALSFTVKRRSAVVWRRKGLTLAWTREGKESGR